MKRFALALLTLAFVFAMSACVNDNKQTQGVTEESFSSSPQTQQATEVNTTSVQAETTNITEITKPTEITLNSDETTASEPTATEESAGGMFHVDGVSQEDMITYFNEVCLDSEFSDGGDSTLVQKWGTPVYYMLHGEYTDTDYKVLTSFVNDLNEIYGFPGMYEVYDEIESNLDIYFCTGEELVDRMGASTNYELLDGAVTFWYDGSNSIYDGVICYRNDIDQFTRSSVILEEIYNGLGPVQDTDLRVDSIIYSGFTTPQEITEVDDVILRLLYHPDIICGMTASECEEVIRSLYY